MKKSILFFTFLSLLAFGRVIGQESRETDTLKTEISVKDTLPKKGIFNKVKAYLQEANVDRSTEKFDISFLAAPSYTQENKFELGAIASGLYRIDRKDTSLVPSNVSLFGEFASSGLVVLGINNHTIFPRDAYRINTYFYFAHDPRNFYGIGYDAGHQGDFSKYREDRFVFDGEFLKKIVTNTYAGIHIEADLSKVSHFSNPDMEPDEPLSNNMVGVGFIASYDSRDFVPNPEKGLLLEYKQSFHPKALGTSRPFTSLEIDTRTYKKPWNSGILAFQISGIFMSGNTPWTMLSMLGGSKAMRGYYLGRYRDKNQIFTQLELRQKIHNRIGATAWVGAGNVFPSFKSWEWTQTLPNYGIGLRWEFKHRTNIRFDYGFGKGSSGFYMGINEAF